MNITNVEPKLKLLLFGATRHSGFHFMQQALEAGHHVTAIIRNPSVFDFKHANLRIVKGDALQLQTFESELSGKDAVISTLGVTDAKPTVLYSRSIENMIEGMRNTGVKRIMCVTAIPLEPNAEMGFLLYAVSKFVLNRLLKDPYNDMRLMETALKKSGLDWTIVRPPQLKDNPLTGKYRTAIGTHLSWPFSIGRADVAHCLLRYLHDKAAYKKVMEIAY